MLATLCLAADYRLNLVAEIANLAGGLVCEKSALFLDKEQLMSEALGL